MYNLTSLASSLVQTVSIILSDGSSAQLTFMYHAAVQRWSLDVEYKGFAARGLGLATHLNLLRIWRSVIPFGIQVSTVDNTDPFLPTDLQSGRVTITILDNTAGNTDVDLVEQENF